MKPAAKPPGNRPVWVEDINALGANLGGAEHLVSLDGDAMLATATAAAGLDDFGAATWREPFAILVAAIAREARLNTVGRLLTRAEILRFLVNRLRIVDAWKRHPEILDRAIEAPIVITGTARSGTSILLELLAQDPSNRCPATWEIFDSVPPPERATYATDPRVAAIDREVTLWHEISPEYLTMHANGGALANECIFLMAHEFASNHFSGVLDVPSYAAWLSTADLGPAYRFHRDQLKLLQWHCAAEQWVLKAPSHLGTLPALFAVYPDARVILTHRDPVKTIASTVSLMTALRRMRSDEVDTGKLAAAMAAGIPLGLAKVMRERADGTLPAERIVDLRFHNLMRDPIAAVRDTYKRLGRALSKQAERRMSAYLAAKPRDAHGRHAYSLEDFGVDRARVREATAEYTARYQIAEED
jgi:hypothetical protein